MQRKMGPTVAKVCEYRAALATEMNGHAGLNFLSAIRQIFLGRPHLLGGMRGSQSLRDKKLAGERHLSVDEDLPAILRAAWRDGERKGGVGAAMVCNVLNAILRDASLDDRVRAVEASVVRDEPLKPVAAEQLDALNSSAHFFFEFERAKGDGYSSQELRALRYLAAQLQREIGDALEAAEREGR